MQFQPRYQPRDEIGGRYLVHEALAGGMGEVYLCLDKQEIYPYALKTFQARYVTNPKLCEAFSQEVATWVSLERHPHIVRCHYMTIIENQPYMFLEWIANDEAWGADLRSWLRRGRLDLRLALDFAIHICRGLMHAGRKQPGIVHRDLKPDNILIGQGRIAKITDFGLAKIVQEAGLEIAEEESEPGRRQHLSRMGGTPAYMAPEQWRGDALDARTDIYAVGCILYEMLTGRMAFGGTRTDELRKQHLEGVIPKLGRNDSLDTVLSRCLPKGKEERYLTVAALLQELSQIYEDRFSESPRELPIGEYTAEDYSNRGYTYARLNRYDEALADYTRAIQVDPNFMLAHSNRGNAYIRLVRYAEGLADLSRALQLDPSSARTLYNRGSAYVKMERYSDALADLTRAIEIDPAYAKAYANRGSAYAGLNRTDKAIEDFTRAIQLEAALAPTYDNRGVAYNKQKRYQEALADFKRAIELDPNLGQAYTNRGYTNTELNHLNEALEDFLRAIQLDSNDKRAYLGRGLAHGRLGNYPKALADFNRAVELDRNEAKAYSGRAIAHEGMRQYEAAFRDYDKAIELDPADAQAYFNAGALYGNLGQLKRALTYLEKAAQLGHPDGERYASLARQMLKK